MKDINSELSIKKKGGGACSRLSITLSKATNIIHNGYGNAGSFGELRVIM